MPPFSHALTIIEATAVIESFRRRSKNRANLSEELVEIAVVVFFATTHGFAISLQNGVDKSKAFQQGIEHEINRVRHGNRRCRPNRQPRLVAQHCLGFEARMNAVLVRQLAVIVLGCVKRNMSIARHSAR